MRRSVGAWVFGAVASGFAAARWGHAAGWSAPSWAWATAGLGLAVAAGIVGTAAGRADAGKKDGAVPGLGRRAGAGLRRWAGVLVLAGLAAWGGGWWTARVVEPGRAGLAAVLPTGPGERALVTVEGVVAGPVETRGSQRGALAVHARWDPPATRFEVRLRRAGFGVAEGGSLEPATGRVWVRVDRPGLRAGGAAAAEESGRLSGVRPGAVVRVSGWGRGLRRPSNPGETDGRLWSWGAGFIGSVSAAGPGLVGIVARPGERAEGEGLFAWSGRVWTGWVGSVRGRLRGVVAGGDEGFDAGRVVMSALLLGDRDHRCEDAAGPWARVGLGHLLAISGLHVGLVIGAVGVGLRVLGVRPVFEAAVLVCVVGAVLVVVPARGPIVRASAMAVVLVCAWLLGRRYGWLGLLGWVAAGVAVWRPMEVFGPGFWLSFVVVGGLIGLTGPTAARLVGAARDPDHRRWWESAGRWCVEAVIATAVAWAVAMPMVVAGFGWVPLWGVPATLLATPIAGVLVVGGYAGLIVAAAAPGSTAVVGAALGWGGGAAAGLVGWVDRLPGGSLRAPELGWVWAWIATAAVLLWIGRLARRTGPGGRERAARWSLTAASVGWLGWSVGSSAAWNGVDRDVSLRVDTLALGDGAAHLVRTRSGSLLVDCGSSWFGVGLRTVPEAVRGVGGWRVPTAVVTHPDTDHFSGLLDAARPMGLRRVIVGEAFAGSASADPDGAEAALLAGLEELGVSVRVVVAGNVIDGLGPGVRAEVLWPPAGYEAEQDNDASVVLLVRVATGAGERVVLFTGDIEDAGSAGSAGVAAALAARGVGRVDVLEAPHHGSAARPRVIEWVGGIEPWLVVQSTGPSRIGDPRWEDVRAGVEARGGWWSTAEVGAVVVEVGRSGRVGSEKRE